MQTPLWTKKQYLRQLVEGKNQWSRQLTAEERAQGFLGWHERGYLPHYDFPGLVQFVTFRLADSLPAERRDEWEHLLALEDAREKRRKLEEYLDRALGSCALRNRNVAQSTEQALLFFNHKQCEILAWCVMPNHVHVLVHIWETPLWKLVRSWKRRVATDCNAERRATMRPDETHSGTTRQNPAPPVVWQREYWDTFMRGDEQERRAIHYIETNPVKARLCSSSKVWPFSSARYRDDYSQLPSPSLCLLPKRTYQLASKDI
jgi:putative transposase